MPPNPPAPPHRACAFSRPTYSTQLSPRRWILPGRFPLISQPTVVSTALAYPASALSTPVAPRPPPVPASSALPYSRWIPAALRTSVSAGLAAPSCRTPATVASACNTASATPPLSSMFPVSEGPPWNTSATPPLATPPNSARRRRQPAAGRAALEILFPERHERLSPSAPPR